jgi:hypothetical protein
MKLFLFLGVVVGGAVATVMKAAKSEPAPDDKGPIAQFKRQARAAVNAGKEEAAQTEAEIMKQYEDAKAGKT